MYTKNTFGIPFNLFLQPKINSLVNKPKSISFISKCSFYCWTGPWIAGEFFSRKFRNLKCALKSTETTSWVLKSLFFSGHT